MEFNLFVDHLVDGEIVNQKKQKLYVQKNQHYRMIVEIIVYGFMIRVQ